MNEDAVEVVFWGARGTFPAVGAEYARFGGDTMCVELRRGDRRLILDAGSGLKALGSSLAAADEAIRVDIVLSHVHIDHIIGLAAFAPFWRPTTEVSIHAPKECVGADGRVLLSVLNPPLFPTAMASLPARVNIRPYALGASIAPIEDVIIRTLPLTHQGPCAALMAHWDGRKICYVTDHEHGDAAADNRLTREVEGADLLIYDATFTDAEWPRRRGWGHSTWQEGVRLKRRSGARRVALVHHEPDRTDQDLDVLAGFVQGEDQAAHFVRQGERLSV